MAMDMSSLRGALTPDYPITGLCVVADKSKCPSGYEVISKTVDGQDADLWRDSFFSRKTLRYFCTTRSFPLDNGRINNVLADMAILSADDTPPPGWSSISTTLDSRETVLKKKQLCVRMLPRENTQAAVCEMTLLAKAKRAPPGYTLIGEINGMLICLKVGPIPRPQQEQQQQQPQSMISMPPSYSMPPTYSMDQRGNPSSSIPYSPTTGAPSPGSMSPTRSGQQVQRSQELQTNPYGIEGVPFELDKRFDAIQTLSNADVPEVSFVSGVEIENKYQYDFKAERQATQRLISP